VARERARLHDLTDDAIGRWAAEGLIGGEREMFHRSHDRDGRAGELPGERLDPSGVTS
jgi:hypothetical protein